MSSPRLVVSSPACPSSRHHLVISFPRFAACLTRRRCLVRHLVISVNLLACRPASRPTVRLAARFLVSPVRLVLPPLGDVIAALSDRPVPFDLRSSVAPLCLSDGWELDGLLLSLSLGRLVVIACSGRMSRLRAFSSLRSALLARVPPFVLVLCRRNCIYDLSRCYNIM